MNVAVTGARGFIGRRVVAAATEQGHSVVSVTRDTSDRDLADAVRRADAVVHLAGVNRPADPAEFASGNGALSERVAAAIDPSRGPVAVYASSTQAALDNPYGRSKRRGEEAFETLGRRGARVAIFRLPNVFGPGARPNYNSAVATFAHNAAVGLPLEVHDAGRDLSLVYVHDVARTFVEALGTETPQGVTYRAVEPAYCVTLGRLADVLTQFAASRSTFDWPDVGSELTRRLYATYLSYLPEGRFAYDLRIRADERGELAEFLKSRIAGQLFVSRTKPGVTRGNHFHYTKTEKFLVLDGDAVVRFRRTDGAGSPYDYHVSGRDFRVVDIPPDYAHSIENVGTTELVVLFWASEIFDPAAPDTHPLNVLSP